MNRVPWRWEERDFGFRFRGGKGKTAAEHYQASRRDEFYVIPPQERKLAKDHIDELAAAATKPGSVTVVASPWRNYELDWDWVQTDDGIPLNYAGCLDREEIERREDEGVQRANEFILGLVEKPTPMPVSIKTIQQIHLELMGTIYPFAGQWRTVALHKGEGPTKWPLPACGIEPLMDAFAREVLSRTPFVTEDTDALFLFVAEVMGELLAIHPFREGNGRTAFILANLLLMQNGLLPLSIYDRRSDQERYFDACEAGRIHKDYRPLAVLVEQWEEQAIARWEAGND